MQHHDDSHPQGEHVHKVRSSLEDDGIGELDAPSVAIWLDTSIAVDAIAGAHQRTERKSVLLTYRGEVSKAHSRYAVAHKLNKTLASGGKLLTAIDRARR